MKIKTSELTGPALNWAVGYAQCLRVTGGSPILSHDLMAFAIKRGMSSPSTNWAQGGPIIERESMELYVHLTEGWTATIRPHRERGATPLIAAMRCYVASKLGDEVEIPEELI